MTRKDSDPSPPRVSQVPSGRLSRFLGLGATASRMVLGGAKEGATRLIRGVEEELPHALLTVKNAEILAARLSRLRGAAMKVGQMLSLEGDNLLPKEFANALAVLRSSAHRMPDDQVELMMKSQLGPNWRERFARFDRVPIASASIGQVHRARSLDGEELAIKVQYPGVAESIESDVDNLRSLLSLSRLVPRGVDLEAFTSEIKAELRREVDYERERNSLLAYREAIGTRGGVIVPRCFPELSGQRVLTLEYMPGIPLLDYAETASGEERNRLGHALFDLFLAELFEFRLMQTDPNPSNFYCDPETGRLILLDFGATRSVSETTAEIYGDAFRALMHRDRDLVRDVLLRLDVPLDRVPEAAPLLIDLALLGAEAVEDRDYDFTDKRILERAQLEARQLSRFRNQLSPPPPEYLFFQRKLGGILLLLRQMGAQFNARRVLMAHGIS